MPNGSRCMIAYPIGDSGQRLILTDAVIDHCRRHRQQRWYQCEAGGQLFARFDELDVFVALATGLRRGDWRSRHAYIPDRRGEQKEIDAQRAKGLHYIGDWHTHPEDTPMMSPVDKASMADCVTRSTHALSGFLLLIVGRAEPPAGFSLSLHDGTSTLKLVGEPS
jgi:integrative and conjugative element protein (TIGR02256 family)